MVGISIVHKTEGAQKKAEMYRAALVITPCYPWPFEPLSATISRLNYGDFPYGYFKLPEGIMSSISKISCNMNVTAHWLSCWARGRSPGRSGHANREVGSCGTLEGAGGPTWTNINVEHLWLP